MKKRNFTLFEILISFGLLAFMITTLFFWHYLVTKEKKLLHQLKRPVLEERYVEQYLSRVFRAVSLKPCRSDEIACFFADNRSLVLTFDNGSTNEPRLSGRVLGKLLFNQQNRNLSIGIWQIPLKEKNPQTTPCYSIILMEDIDNVEFQFYSPKDPFALIVSPGQVNNPTPQIGWQSIWKQEYNTLPLIVKVICTRHIQGQDFPIIFSFDLQKTIIYPKEIGEA